MKKLNLLETTRIKEELDELILEPDNKIVAINAVELTITELVNSVWYQNYKDGAEKTLPSIVVRVLDSENTGWDIIMIEKNNRYRLWQNEDFGISGPAYEGHIEEDEDGNNIPLEEALEWVEQLNPLDDLYL